MDLSFRYDLWYTKLPKSPPDLGRLVRIVVRPEGSAEGTRETPEEAKLEPGIGIVGDKWHAATEPPGTEVSVINVHVLRSLAESEERMPLSGDNLHVDLDLSEESLPVGSRLILGEVELEVSPVPHRPCRSFHARFGGTAAKKVARAGRRGRRGRGVMCTVVSPGTIRCGVAIRVERPK